MLNSLTAIVFFLYGSLGFPNLPALPLEQTAVIQPAAAPEPAPAIVKKCSLDLGQKLEFFTACQWFREGLKVTYLSAPKLSAQIDPLIKKYGKRYGIDENLIRAVLQKESGGNPIAVSPKFAMGLMQLIPETAIAMGVEDPFNPEQNIAGGVKYLKYCLDRYAQDVILALAAYNAGPEAVKKHGGVPPYAETQQYVASIIGCPVEDIINLGKTEEEKKLADNPDAPQESKEPGKQAGRLPKPVWKMAASGVATPPKWKILPSFTTVNSSQVKLDTLSEAAKLSKDLTRQPADGKDITSQGNIAIPRHFPNHGYR